MHSIVTTFREAVIKVEVANFGAAIDTLIDQDGGPWPLSHFYRELTLGCITDCTGSDTT